MRDGNTLKFRNIIFDIFKNAYLEKNITIYSNLKNYEFQYETLKYIEKEIKNSINENDHNKVFEMFSLLIKFFKDIDFLKKYYVSLSKNEIKTYASHNFEINDIKILFNKMDDFISGNFENIDSKKVKEFTILYLRLIFNKNDLNINEKEKRILEMLI